MTNDEIMNLSGDDLDHAVAIAHDWIPSNANGGLCSAWRDKDKNVVIMPMGGYFPSTNGNQLLEIMDREKISITPCTTSLWEAEIFVDDIFITATGDTINEAVLRCFLMSKQPPK